ncbi:hypothetical protein [Streptomyces odontomachi]|uniref:hypothetical protein n=1 Tax=Streptomyces odontomachi TaxID=2944940 RepID=UPI002108E789|nr:hypothetical protein [Streptomyces sp. ODS25]
MRTYVGHLVAANMVTPDESAFGEAENSGFGAEDFRTLFVGKPGETAEEADARAEVAREVFAELMDEGVDDEIARLDAAYAAWLLCAASLRRYSYHEPVRDVARVEAAA